MAESMFETGQIKASKLLNDFQEISFLEIALIIVSSWLVVYVMRKALPYLAERGPSQLRLYLLGAVPIIRLFVLTGAALWIIPLIFNITFQNFLVIAGGASVAIGFAFKDYVSSIIAGVVAIFEKPYRPGDWVKIDGDYGEVRSVGMRSLEIVTPADDVVTVPHDRLWSNNISNSNDGAKTLMCVANFYLEPAHDTAVVRAVLEEVALTSAYLEYSKSVLVIVTQEPWGTHYKLKAYPFDMRDQFAFITDLTGRGKQAIRETGSREVMVQAIGQGR